MPEFIATKNGLKPLPADKEGAELDAAAAAILAANGGPPDPPPAPTPPAAPAPDEE